MFQTIERYEHYGLGLPYPVVIINSVEEELDDSGNRIGIHIPNSEGLAAVVALSRAIAPLELSGAEVRFIRSVLDMTGKEFAAAFDMDASTLSRWENDKHSMGGWADKQVRLAAIVMLQSKVPGFDIDGASVIGMRPAKRLDGTWPQIEVRLVHVADHSATVPASDTWAVSHDLLAA